MIKEKFSGASGAASQDHLANQASPLLGMVRKHVHDLNNLLKTGGSDLSIDVEFDDRSGFISIGLLEGGRDLMSARPINMFPKADGSGFTCIAMPSLSDQIEEMDVSVYFNTTESTDFSSLEALEAGLEDYLISTMDGALQKEVTSTLSEARAYYERLQSYDPEAFDWNKWPEPDVGSAGTVLPFSTVQSVFRKIMRAVNNQEETHGIEADVNSIEFLNHYTRHHDTPNAEAQAGFPTASLRLTSHHDGSMIDVVALKDRRELLLVSQSAVIGMGDYSRFRDGAAFQQALLNR
ncbi:MAG: hypothetical protein KDJ75_07905, partial [Alphaproteobacteria bacterium]|nr:hypothetical protein [Alphaproteobacteria bacterium]